jgi:hypothetical protein
MVIRALPINAVAELLAWHREDARRPGDAGAFAYLYRAILRLGEEVQDDLLRGEPSPADFARQADVERLLRDWLTAVEQFLADAGRDPAAGDLEELRGCAAEAREALADGRFALTADDLRALRAAEAEQWAETQGAGGDFVEDVIRDLQAPNP